MLLSMHYFYLSAINVWVLPKKLSREFNPILPKSLSAEKSSTVKGSMDLQKIDLSYAKNVAGQEA